MMSAAESLRKKKSDSELTSSQKFGQHLEFGGEWGKHVMA